MFTAYLNRGIAKRLIQNKQSTPTPCRYVDPTRGVDTSTHERFDCRIPWIWKFWRISIEEPAKTLFNMYFFETELFPFQLQI